MQFPALQRLILTNCRGLQKLPRNMGQSIPGLKALEMENCSLIAVLPDSIAQLKHLEHMILFGCENLESLPDGVVNLTQLKRLLLNDCSKLKRLPMEVGRLLNLEVLNLSNCKALLELPPSVKGLRMLKELHMKSTCQSDGRLLSFMGALTALKTLHLCRNEMIAVVPRSFEDLTSLLRLQMTFCSSLNTVEALPRSLQYLDLTNCPQLIHFPSVAKISSLVTLNLCNCKSLTEIDGLEFLTALEDINLAGCTSLLHTEQPVLHCKSLRTCYLSGSKVAVAYDSKWSEVRRHPLAFTHKLIHKFSLYNAPVAVYIIFPCTYIILITVQKLCLCSDGTNRTGHQLLRRGYWVPPKWYGRKNLRQRMVL